VIEVDYSNEGSIQHALTGVDVVISTIPAVAIDIQVKIAAAAKNVGVKLFVPSEFGGKTDGETDGVFGAKGNVQSQLKALDIPYTAFYTGLFADYAWVPCVSLIHLRLFRLANHRLEGTSSSTSGAGKCPLVATATSRLRSPPERILPDMYPMS
jgi:uncharacterized protein YbjT (DUF2867 family)